MQRAAADQLVEPAPEKKIVYDLVDVPLGTNIAFEPGENEKPDLTDTALSYDPDTGFYLNPQFDEAGNVPTENDASGNALLKCLCRLKKLAFPPFNPLNESSLTHGCVVHPRTQSTRFSYLEAICLVSHALSPIGSILHAR